MKVRGWSAVAVAAVGVAAAGVGGCQALTRSEASAALEEASLDGEVAALTSGSVEIATDFTIGGAIEDAAAEIAAFVRTQLPCAEVTVEAATLTIEYGARAGTCLYRGRTYGGVHQITVMRNQMDDVVVSHRWVDFHDARFSVTGTAMVTWSFADRSRRVVHELTWTRQSDGRQGVGRGDRVQRPLEAGLLTGLRVDGERSWEGQAGTWTLDIDAIEMRWIDAVPQAGAYVLTTPAGKVLSMSFERAAPTTITVTISNGASRYDFDVTTLPGE